ncbi:MAG: hypothetical protein M3P93_16830 [Actinomycetota bacterium]|nr:hypothetical protein [Actinomycetota bacterium]
MTTDGGPDSEATVAQAAPVELDEPSVLSVALLLARWVREPAVWVRAAVTTLDRFRKEVAGGDLAGLLAAGQADPAVAERSLRQLAVRHDGLTGGQLAALAFGPRLWWTVAGVPVPWRPLSSAGGAAPLPGRDTDPDLRLLLLALLGSGATEPELLAVRVRDAGRLDADGVLVPDLEAEPLVVRYSSAQDGREHLAFLSYEARLALQQRLAERGQPGPDEALLLPEARQHAASQALQATSAALIGAGNDVNVSLCRATGNFFRAWGMPGARFEARARPAEESDPLSRSTTPTTTSEESP